jgi:hypothetical protein
MVYPDIIYSDKITAAEKTREISLHDGLISYDKMLAAAREAYGDTVTIANIRIYTEEFKTRWFGRNSDVQAMVDVHLRHEVISCKRWSKEPVKSVPYNP